jgi:hypothetical protein
MEQDTTQQQSVRPNRNFPVAIEVTPETRFTKCTTRVVSVADLHPSERQYHPEDHRKREYNPDLVYANPAANVDPSAAASAPPPAAPPAAASLPAKEGLPAVAGLPTAAPPAEVKPAQPKPDPAHHGRRCGVCNHPNREAIEGDFLNWRSPEMIAREFNIRDRAFIYRHAGAFNLYAQRKRQLGRVLENIIECSDLCTFDHCDMIIRAARVYAHLDDEGKWHEPPRTHYIFTSRISALPQSSESSSPPQRQGSSHSKVSRRGTACRARHKTRRGLIATVPNSKKG